MLTAARLGQVKAGKWVLHHGLPNYGQEPKSLGHLRMLSQVYYQRSGSKAEFTGTQTTPSSVGCWHPHQWFSVLCHSACPVL